MKRILIVSIAILVHHAARAQVKNTSYTNSVNERVLRHELVLNTTLQNAWDWCTRDSLLAKWAAPLVHMELRAGGYRAANYDPAKSLSDSSSIVLPLVLFIDKKLMVFKINLNANFPPGARSSDQNLYFLFEFKSIDKVHTQITGSMMGWGAGEDWDKTYNFFVRGNEWTFAQLLKNFQPGPAKK